MLKDLSIRNAKRQAKEYVVYFFALVLSNSLLFAFNALIFSKDIQSTIEMSTAIRFFIIVISVIIVFILSWLINYMMKFMLKKRSKELSIYRVLGIENKEVIRLFQRENLLIGFFASLAGYLGGMLLFQILKAVVSNLIGGEYKISYDLSIQAFLLTTLYFIAIFAVSIFRSNRTIKKLKLYDLLYYDQYNEKINGTKKSIWILTFCFSLLSLAIAIYLLMETPLGDGRDFSLSILAIALFIYCFFLSLPKIIVTILQSGNWKYIGSHAIILRNVSSKINSISSTMGFLSIAFTLALYLISIGSVGIATFNYRISLAPFDISIMSTDEGENMQKYQDYINVNFNVVGEQNFNIYRSDSTVFSDLEVPYFGMNTVIVGDFLDNTQDLLMTYTDYSNLREMLGYASVDMNDHEFLIHSLSFFYSDFRDHAIQNPLLHIKGHPLDFAEIYTENFDQYDGFPNGWMFILIVPDFVVNDTEYLFTKYSVITDSPVSISQYDALLYEFNTLSSLSFPNENHGQDVQISDRLDSRIMIQKHNGISVVTVLLPMWYIAFILCIAGVTILVSHILSEEAGYKRQFTLLRNLGYSKKRLDKILMIQLANFFIVPLIPATILNFILSPLLAKSLVH